MALLYISEYAQPAILNGLTVLAGQEPSTDQSPVATSAASAQSAAFKNNTQLVRLHNDSSSAICIVFGANPTAVTSTQKRMAANATEYFAVTPSSGLKVAAVTVAT
jgi:hypothetical protein